MCVAFSFPPSARADGWPAPLGYYVAFIIALIGVALFTIYHKQIVDWLKPAADWMHE